jgi:capsular exopolysaccharide synthesis family protein
VIGVTVLALGTALAYSAQQTPLYSSFAEVLVRPINLDPTEPSTASGFIDMGTEERVAGSTLVGELAGPKLTDLPQAAGLSVKRGDEANTLTFQAASRSPISAQRTAQAYAEAYLDFRRNSVRADLEAASKPIEKRIIELTTLINQAQGRLVQTAPGNESVRTGLQITLNSLLTERTFLEQRRNDLILPENVRVGEMLRAANFPRDPTSPDHKRNAAFALFVGLALGVGIAFLRDRMDQRFRDRAQFEREIGIPVLGAIPPLTRKEKSPRSGILTSATAPSPAAEAYKSLRASVLFATSERGLRSLLVTSCVGDEGKTITTAKLGVALAQLEKSVVVVSADLRHPALERYFAVTKRAGLTSVLSSQDELNDALVVTDLPSLGILPAGPLPGNPAELLGSIAMRKLLRRLRSLADIVLIDSAPVLGIADAPTLASMADVILLVVDASRTTRSMVLDAKHELDRVGANVVGAVLTNYRGADGHPFYPQAGRNGRARPRLSALQSALDGTKALRTEIKGEDVPRRG